jgi:hypothetical protein
MRRMTAALFHAERLKEGRTDGLTYMTTLTFAFINFTNTSNNKPIKPEINLNKFLKILWLHHARYESNSVYKSLSAILKKTGFRENVLQRKR